MKKTLRALAVLATLPYISLKIAWVAGSRIGIPENSVLLDDPGLMAVLNSVTVLMDLGVVVLALLLTQPWGLRVRSWLLGLPMWAATGLLAPIVVGFPVQLATAAVAGAEQHTAGGEPFLEEWVFSVVYGGFIVQALALGTLFVLYARDRWSHVWAGRVGELAPDLCGRATRVTAVAASVLALVPAALHVLWASGAEWGLSAARIADRTSDYYVLEAVRAGFVVAAAAAVLTLVFRLGKARRVGAPLAAAWIGTGGVGCWGAWMLLAASMPGSDPAKEPTAQMITSYAGEMITGFLLAGCLTVFLRRRGA
ncbi:hypothetical protein ACGFMM_17355 [Streptomyces sp. NPDC048604]|uniref:hypothetical protein n=1 Tax=Streptomyces sp. NPDC048604 TaxID=3365578 RepID=UPI003716B8C5